jgi:ammonium transporter, Amt family
MSDVATIFAEQVTLSQLVQNILYASGTVGALFVVAGLVLLDTGGLRRRNSFNATIEKMVGFFIGFSVYFLIGFTFWAAQYYIMYEGPDYSASAAFMDSIKQLWAGGSMSNALAQHVDPAVFPGLNNFQIFIFFLAVFAGIANILLHFAVSERMKPAAFYITCVVTTLVTSYVSQWTWGSVGLLTNLGFHDFFGMSFLYLIPAGMAMVFAKTLGARPGIYDAHPKVPSYRVPNLGLVTVGILIIFASLPMVIMSCLFFFETGGAEALAVSVTMADTSVGVAFNSYGMAWAGGALGGAVIAYKARSYSYLFLGPFAGYVAGAPGYDVYVPWEAFLVAFCAPFVTYVVYQWMVSKKIDEHKLIPLFAAAGSYGLIMVGLLKAGTPRGGWIDFAEGPYAYQSSEIGVGIQIVGIGACLGAGILTALILSFVLKHTVGLRVSDDDQAEGLDKVFWDVECDVEVKGEKTSS